MKASKVLLSIGRIFAAALSAIVLLVFGLIFTLYSPWAQNELRTALVNKLSDGDTQFVLDHFALRFPLTLEVGWLRVVSAGDTLVAARSLQAEASLLPLLAGKAEVERLQLLGGRFVMGSPDSAMYMTVSADSLAFAPVMVELADMAIELPRGIISGGRLAMTLKNDTTPSAPSDPTKMSIALGDIDLENFEYEMHMMPSIDTLRAFIASARVHKCIVDLLSQNISISSFCGHGLDANYITPDSASLAAAGPLPAVAAEPDTAAVAPWTVKIDTISFDKSKALYAVAGASPLPGLDFNYMAFDSLRLNINNFYNCATTVSVPLRLAATERCGVSLDVAGTLDIDSAALTFKNVKLRGARGTDVSFDGLMGMGDMASDPSLLLRVNLDGAFAPSELGMMFPAFKPYFAAIPSADDILLVADVDGTMGQLDINSLKLRLNHCLNLQAGGTVRNMMEPSRLEGNIKIAGNVLNMTSFKNALLPKETASMFNIPSMTLAGNVLMARGVVSGNLKATTTGGSVALDGRWSSTAESYKGSVVLGDFPVMAFMPLLGVERVTASLEAEGRGYSPFVKTTSIDAVLNVSEAEYNKVIYKDISGKMHLADGQAAVSVDSSNPDADFSLDAKGNLDGNEYRWTAELDGRYIDLYALKFALEPSSIETRLRADAVIGPGKSDMAGTLWLDDFFFRRPSGTIGFNDIKAEIVANDSLTDLSLTNRDLKGRFNSSMPIDSLVERFSRVGEILSGQIENYDINGDTVARTLPPFTLMLSGDRSNLVNDILAPSKMSVKSFAINASNDSTLTLRGNVMRFDTGSMVLDSIYIGAREHDGHYHFGAGFENRPGNLDDWHQVSLDGAVTGNRMAMKLHQENLKKATGFDLGLTAEASKADSSLTVRIDPLDPVIGYQQWSANDDNFITYTIPTQHIDANLHMKGGNSSLAIFTEEAQGHDSHGHTQEDLVVRLDDIHLSDWVSVSPFLPPVKGDINADIRVNRTNGEFTGKGMAAIKNFIYGKEKVADMKADFDVSALPSGTLRALANVYIDGVKTMTLSGALNDSTSTSPYALDFSMIRVPLATVNPFLPKTVGRLSGLLNGTLKISGDSDKPVFNGTLDFDSTAVRLAMTGTSYRFSDENIRVVDNLVQLKDFAIYACNNNPLTINGTVDISDMADAKLNLAMKADNMQIVNSKRLAKNAEVYGKGFVSLNANVHGSMSLLNINADVSVNSGTNVTYVIPDATTALASQSNEGMVKFVNFADSSSVVAADSINNAGMLMFLDATLTIENGTTINVDLSSDGKNRVQLQSNGSLTYSMTPLDDGRLTGRLNIDKGFVRYSPPLMSEKLFNFDDGSYVSFNGDMMNPTLNIHATDVLKANVTQDGQNSRLVNFDVLLAVTGTLNQMNVAFDLKTNDDITVANELESMSAEQRANQAMNMLLYNVYTGPGTKANSSLAGNPLFSFLESQINSWAANNIKGVDLSFGIDQYDKTVDGSTSQAMSYSYQVSKSLFNDRFKIVVGGNYTTDANADENFSQNLINDISFEYFINKQRTMYVRLFRHTGYESILEGEITETGVGFVYRRKIMRLVDMFLPQRIIRRKEEQRQKKQIEEYNQKIKSL